MANPWITFLKKYYADRKKKQPGYKYSDAMKDAKVEYDKTTGSSHTKSPKKGKKMRGGSGYGAGSHLANASSIDESSKTLSVGGDVTAPEVPEAPEATAATAATTAPQSGGKKSRRRKGTKGKKSKKCKSKRRKSRSSRK